MNGTIPWEITQRKGRMTLICTASTYRFVQHNNCNHNTLFDCTIEIEIIQKDGKISSLLVLGEKFEDTKGIIRIRNSKYK
jgi:hypothetical protein